MMDYSEYEYLKIEVAERVATVTINRPDQLNAVHAALHHEVRANLAGPGRRIATSTQSC